MKEIRRSAMCVFACCELSVSGGFCHRDVVLRGLVGDSMWFLTFFKKNIGFFAKISYYIYIGIVKGAAHT